MKRRLATVRHLPLFIAMSLALSPACAIAVPVGAPPAAAPDRLASPRLIVRYRDDAASAIGLTVRTQTVRRTLDAAMVRSGITPPASASRKTRSAAPEPVRRLGSGAELIALPPGLTSGNVHQLVQEIAADPAVRYVEVDTLQHPMQAQAPFVPNDAHYASHQWHFHDPLGGANVPGAWQVTRGEGVVVAVIDTGILAEHPDFKNTRLLPGYDFITDPFISRRREIGPAPGAADLGDWSAGVVECGPGAEARTSGWHGTHVAGTIAQSTHNEIGGAGVAPGVTVLPVRVLGRCGGWTSDIIDAITWASGGSVPHVPDNPNPAQVLNLSLGGSKSCSSAYQEAIDAAISRGAIIVAAAGNSSEDVSGVQPAGCRNMIAVGASSGSGHKADYSNYGDRIDLAAPGGDKQGGNLGYIWQAGYTGPTTPQSGTYNYVGYTGTSMAAPHVAATAALVQAARVRFGRLPLSQSRMEAVLVASARPFPRQPPPGKPIGRGILDTTAAVAMALAADCDIAVSDCRAPATLQPQVPVSGLAGAPHGTVYAVSVRGGRPLRVMTYGGQGEARLYVRRAAAPQGVPFDAQSTRPGTHQSVLLANPAEGIYHVWITGAPSYGGLSMVVRQ